MKPEVLVFYGPTASGKSAAALEYAAQHKTRIINSDAMQCYDALHQLTAQPSIEEQDLAPHSLYGFTPPSKDTIVTNWMSYAAEEIKAAFENNEQPILVGGTGFYIKSLINGLSNIPDIPKSIRMAANQIFEAEGIEPLLNDLKKYSIEDLQQIDTNNPRRIIRAWETLQHTGKSIQEWHREEESNKSNNQKPDYNYNIRLITRPRDELIERISTRFDQMIKNGALDEVRSLSDKIDNGIVSKDNLITKAHGFRPLRRYLKQEVSLEDAVEKSKIETRQYAKRQMTWARQQFQLDTKKAS